MRRKFFETAVAAFSPSQPKSAPRRARARLNPKPVETSASPVETEPLPNPVISANVTINTRRR